MKHAIRLVLPLLVLAVGFAVASLLVFSTPTPQRTTPKPPVARVSVRSVEVGPQPVLVSGTGTVLSARQVDLRPEVAGRVVGQHPLLEPGGRLSAGATAVRIDPRDYRARVVEAEAQLERARFELKLEEGRQKVAKKEFELLGRDDSMVDDASLALRKPHLINAQAAVRAAEASLDLARTQLARTRVRVPFNAVVLEESVEEGQLVNNQTSIAKLVGTDRFWVQVSIPVAALEWLRFSGDDEEPTSVEVIQDLGRGRSVRKTGSLVRLLSDVDPKGRLARVLVQIEDPLDLGRDPALREPLLLGAFVQVRMEGRQLEEVASVPRRALRDGDAVWLMAPDDTLEIRRVTPSWRGPEWVYVRDQLRAGERLVVSRIPTPVPGMPLKAMDASGPVPEPASGRL